MSRKQRTWSAVNTFVCTALILFAALALQSIFPCGGRHILTVDLYHQYAPFLSELRHKLLSGGSLYYSYHVGLGVNFYALFCYYLASPLNFLCVLVPLSLLSEFVLFLVIVKVGLAAIAFNIYLSEINTNTEPTKSYQHIVFGIAYGLSGFVMAYFWNIMWLDTLIWLPFVSYFLIRFIKRQNVFLRLVFSLWFLIVTNFYTGFFALVFLLLFLPFLLRKFAPEETKYVKFFGLTLLKILGVFVLALLLSSVVILPVVKALQSSSAYGEALTWDFNPYTNLLSYFGRHLLLQEPSIRTVTPNIYCTLLALILMPIYFFSETCRRQKLYALFIYLFLLFSFNIDTINFLWHGMHFPNQLSYRYAFVYIFFFLTLADLSYTSLKNNFNSNKKNYLYFQGSVILILVLIHFALNTDDNRYLAEWANVFFVLCYMVILGNHKALQRRSAKIALVGLFFCELLLNTSISMLYVNNNEYFGKRADYTAGGNAMAVSEALQFVNRSCDIDPAAKYRALLLPKLTENDPSLFNFAGESAFASTMPLQNVGFLRDLGLDSNGVNSYAASRVNLLRDSLLGCKYYVVKNNADFGISSLPCVFKHEKLKVYENPYVMPIAFAAPNQLLLLQNLEDETLHNQNRIADILTGHTLADTAKLYTNIKLAVGETDAGLKLSPSGDRSFYYAKNSPEIKMANISVRIPENGYYTLSYKIDKQHINLIRIKGLATTSDLILTDGCETLDLGKLRTGSNIQLTVEFNADDKFSGNLQLEMAKLNIDRLQQIALRSQKQALHLTEFSDTTLKGEVFADQDHEILFMSIPYDQGFSCELDGKSCQLATINDSLLAIPLQTKGRHEVVLKYMPPGFKTGVLVFVITLLLALTIWMLERHLNCKKLQEN